MLGKYSKDKDKLIWKDNKSENFSMNSFDSSLESRGEVPSLKGSVGLLGAFKNGFFFSSVLASIASVGSKQQ